MEGAGVWSHRPASPARRDGPRAVRRADQRTLWIPSPEILGRAPCPVHLRLPELSRRSQDCLGAAGTWINTAADKITALVELLHEQLLNASFIHMDETYLQVLKSEKAPTFTHYTVVRTGGPSAERIVLFNYAASRTVEVLKKLLIGPSGPYQGKLLTDGLDLYDSVAEVLHLRHYGCLAHCR